MYICIYVYIDIYNQQKKLLDPLIGEIFWGGRDGMHSQSTPRQSASFIVLSPTHMDPTKVGRLLSDLKIRAILRVNLLLLESWIPVFHFDSLLQ